MPLKTISSKDNALLIALKEYGTSDFMGQATNPKVLEYFKESGNAWVNDDDTAWCSAFMSFVAKKAGLARSMRLNARSWLEVGLPVLKPELGDVVVLWRISKTSPYGHVGLFIADMGDYIYILGGNQSSKVSIQAFPKSQVLGYRHLQEEVIK